MEAYIDIMMAFCAGVFFMCAVMMVVALLNK